MKRFFYLIITLLLPLNVSAQSTIFDIIADSPDHEILEAAIIQADMVDNLSWSGSRTIFAPTDEAFESLPAGILDSLLQSPNYSLNFWLLNHMVVFSSILTTDLNDGDIIKPFTQKDIVVRIDGDNIYVNQALIITKDLIADNGTVQVIDAVLPPSTFSVYDIIESDQKLDILETALLATGLNGALNQNGPFTVFAPTEAAFQELSYSNLETLLDDPSGDLTDILLYHVVSGEIKSNELVEGQMIPTLNGEELLVTINDGNIFINDAQVLNPDILAGNGLVHKISAVLIPRTTPTKEIWPEEIKVYPNPADSYLKIEFENNKFLDAQINMRSLDGKLIQTFTERDILNPLDISEITTGLYLLEFLSKDLLYTKRVMIR